MEGVCVVPDEGAVPNETLFHLYTTVLRTAECRHAEDEKRYLGALEQEKQLTSVCARQADELINNRKKLLASSLQASTHRAENCGLRAAKETALQTLRDVVQHQSEIVGQFLAAEKVEAEVAQLRIGEAFSIAEEATAAMRNAAGSYATQLREEREKRLQAETACFTLSATVDALQCRMKRHTEELKKWVSLVGSLQHQRDVMATAMEACVGGETVRRYKEIFKRLEIRLSVSEVVAAVVEEAEADVSSRSAASFLPSGTTPPPPMQELRRFSPSLYAARVLTSRDLTLIEVVEQWERAVEQFHRISTEAERLRSTVRQLEQDVVKLSDVAREERTRREHAEGQLRRIYEDGKSEGAATVTTLLVEGSKLQDVNATLRVALEAAKDQIAQLKEKIHQPSDEGTPPEVRSTKEERPVLLSASELCAFYVEDSQRLHRRLSRAFTSERSVRQALEQEQHKNSVLVKQLKYSLDSQQALSTNLAAALSDVSQMKQLMAEWQQRITETARSPPPPRQRPPSVEPAAINSNERILQRLKQMHHEVKEFVSSAERFIQKASDAANDARVIAARETTAERDILRGGLQHVLQFVVERVKAQDALHTELWDRLRVTESDLEATLHQLEQAETSHEETKLKLRQHEELIERHSLVALESTLGMEVEASRAYPAVQREAAEAQIRAQAEELERLQLVEARQCMTLEQFQRKLSAMEVEVTSLRGANGLLTESLRRSANAVVEDSSLTELRSTPIDDASFLPSHEVSDSSSWHAVQEGMSRVASELLNFSLQLRSAVDARNPDGGSSAGLNEEPPSLRQVRQAVESLYAAAREIIPSSSTGVGAARGHVEGVEVEGSLRGQGEGMGESAMAMTLLRRRAEAEEAQRRAAEELAEQWKLSVEQLRGKLLHAMQILEGVNNELKKRTAELQDAKQENERWKQWWRQRQTGEKDEAVEEY